MSENKNKRFERLRNFKSSISDFIYNLLNWKWKYLIWLIFLMVNEYNLEFSKLTSEDQEEIIKKNITLHGGDIEVEKAMYEASLKLDKITDFISKKDKNQSNQPETLAMIDKLSEFVDANVGEGYQAGLSEIRSIRVHQADVYYITDSFLILVLFLFLSYDGSRYTYIHNKDRYFLYGLSSYAFKAAILWGLNDFLSNIFTSAERLLKNEILICMVILYGVFIALAIWEDVKSEILKKKKQHAH